MRRTAVLTALSLVAALALAPLGAADGRVQGRPAPPARHASAPRFHPMACPHGTFPDRLDVDCGYVRVPQDRAHPDGRQIHVAAAVVHSTAPHPGDPILLLPGGPSAGSITRVSIRIYFAGTDWAADHDIVLVDTRGVGISTPHVGCPEEDHAGVRSFYSGPYVDSHAVRIFGAGLRKCRARLVSEGIDPADYTVPEALADLEDLRRALGARKWNLMAVSADGILGMSYVREHPESIRAAIVDSGMAPQMMGLMDYDYGLRIELEKVFAGCAANRACRHTYPHVRRSFMRLVRHLNRHPRIIRLPRFRPHPVRFRVDGVGAYYDATHRIFPGNVFAPEEIHALLDHLWRETHGELAATVREDFGTGPVAYEGLDRYLALGRTMSLECHAVTNFVTRRDRRRAARDMPWYRTRFLGRHFDLADTIDNPRSPAGCRIWDVGRAAPRQHRPVVSNVPALVLAGEYDGGVTPYTVRKNVGGLSNGTYVEFPAAAHLQLAFFNQTHRCARSMAEAFLAHPHAPVDTSCRDAMPAFDFTPPEEPPRARPPAWRPLGFPRTGFGTGGWRL